MFRTVFWAAGEQWFGSCPCEEVVGSNPMPASGTPKVPLRKVLLPHTAPSWFRLVDGLNAENNFVPFCGVLTYDKSTLYFLYPTVSLPGPGWGLRFGLVFPPLTFVFSLHTAALTSLTQRRKRHERLTAQHGGL